jgi:hypothetical protein
MSDTSPDKKSLSRRDALKRMGLAAAGSAAVVASGTLNAGCERRRLLDYCYYYYSYYSYYYYSSYYYSGYSGYGYYSQYCS